MLQPANKNFYQPQKTKFRFFRGLLLLGIWLAILGLLAFNRQNINDWWLLRHYQPPPAVAHLADQDTMTDYGRKIFYVNHASIESKTAFPQECPNNGGEQTIVLGCYHSNQAGIFLLSVTDPRLDGVEQVTAAHEMLHGAYDRLSSSAKARVDAMLLDYYNHDLHDQRVRDTIAAYRKSEPHDVVNEMHSVFGSEIAHLPAGLEQYYKHYFTDRSKVTGYAAQYQAVFTSRQTAVAQDDSQLAGLKQQIDSSEADLKTKQASIQSGQSSLSTLRSSGDIKDYNAGIPAYNSLIDSYNAEVATVQSLVGQYNALVATRNALALEEGQLTKELSTNAASISR